MKSREPVLVHGRDYWDEVSLPPAEFHDRIEVVRKRMMAADIDTLLVYGRGDDDGDLCYVSNLVNKVPNWGLLVAIGHDDVLVRNERSSRTRPVIERGTWISTIQFVDNVVADVEDVIGDAGSTVATAGFDRLPYRQRKRFERETNDYDVVSFDDEMAVLRARKSRRERDQVARAGRVLADVQASLPSADGFAGDERALATAVDQRARLRGAQDVRFLVSNPAETEPHLRPAEPNPVSANDPIVLYTAVRYEGYWAECARTRRPDGGTPYANVYDDVADAYESFLDSLRAGVNAGPVVESTREDVAATSAEISAAYDFGNGIGVGTEEAPVLGDADAALEAGMTLSARLAVAPDEESLLVFNDTVAVRDGPPAVLTDDTQ